MWVCVKLNEFFMSVREGGRARVCLCARVCVKGDEGGVG